MGTCVRRVVVAACAVACMLIWAAAPGSAVTTYYCDFENGQKRTIKDSGYWFRDLIAKNEIAYDETLV